MLRQAIMLGRPGDAHARRARAAGGSTCPSALVGAMLLCMYDDDTILVMLLADQIRQHHELNVITVVLGWPDASSAQLLVRSRLCVKHHARSCDTGHVL